MQQQQQQQQQQLKHPFQLETSIQGGVGTRQQEEEEEEGHAGFFQWSDESFKVPTHQKETMPMKDPEDREYISIKLSESPFLNRDQPGIPTNGKLIEPSRSVNVL